MIIPLVFALLLGAAPAGSATTAAPATAETPAASVAPVTPTASTAPADTFAARVLRGRLIEAGSTGPAYQKILWAQLDGPMADALKACILSHAPADKSPFTVVADVLDTGSPSAVEAQPATPVATCLAAWFARTTLPPPPKLPDTPTYPLEIDISITP